MKHLKCQQIGFYLSHLKRKCRRNRFLKLDPVILFELARTYFDIYDLMLRLVTDISRLTGQLCFLSFPPSTNKGAAFVIFLAKNSLSLIYNQLLITI